jgi:hypothetical protein
MTMYSRFRLLVSDIDYSIFSRYLIFELHGYPLLLLLKNNRFILHVLSYCDLNLIDTFFSYSIPEIILRYTPLFQAMYS